MDGSLFISYSHADAQWMQVFKKHLNGILADRCRVWTDEDIPAGTTWEERLLGNLHQAAAGLILVSPDYLVSPWCRRELKSLAEARNNNQLAAVYWVLLQPCGWKWCELAELQAVQEPADRAVLGVPEGQERERHLLHCCETIGSDLISKLSHGNPVIATMRAILARSKHGAMITPIKALSEGDFSIVCRGVYASGEDVVVKVLTNTPLHRMRELFFEVSKACRAVTAPAVIRTIEVFTDGEGYEQRIVILSELARGEPLSEVMKADAALPPDERHLTPDNIGMLLRRVADALAALHALPAIRWSGGGDVPYQHLMGPLIPGGIFYDRAAQRPQLSLVGVTNFLWHFFEPDTFRRIVGPKNGTYLLPEKCNGAQLDAAADQYFLGMLALELLEGRPLFVAAENESPADPLDILRQARWAQRHQQLGAIVARLLAKDPQHRFGGGMTEVLANLRSLEDSSRALAKYSFRTYVAPEGADGTAGVAFAKQFYRDFLARAPAAEQLFREAQRQRSGAVAPAQAQQPAIPDDIQYRKLMDGLKAVLNFRSGGQPSAIDSVAARHAGFQLDAQMLTAFEASFIATLADTIQRTADGAAELDGVIDAWRRLFDPVNREMLDAAQRHNTIAP